MRRQDDIIALHRVARHIIVCVISARDMMRGYFVRYRDHWRAYVRPYVSFLDFITQDAVARAQSDNDNRLDVGYILRYDNIHNG